MSISPIERAFGTLLCAYLLWVLYVLGKKLADAGRIKPYLYAMFVSFVISICLAGPLSESRVDRGGVNIDVYVFYGKTEDHSFLSELIYLVFVTGAPLLVGVYQGRKERKLL